MKHVSNLTEAMKFFLENSEGSVLCKNEYGNEKECDSFVEAEQFYLHPPAPINTQMLMFTPMGENFVIDKIRRAGSENPWESRCQRWFDVDKDSLEDFVEKTSQRPLLPHQKDIIRQVQDDNLEQRIKIGVEDTLTRHKAFPSFYTTLDLASQRLCLENDQRLFIDIRLNDKPLKDCELVFQDKHNSYRLYVDKDSSRNEFQAYAVEFAYCTGHDINDPFNDPTCVVMGLFHLEASFDGARYLHFNREAGDMSGYMYYPNLQVLSDMFRILAKIEAEICKDK
ncbi:hypothetical protein I6Y99_004351 [Vibrio parahaemolyticus]|nr:hypothetical protein [Vibrio parahaemolyticus]